MTTEITEKGPLWFLFGRGVVLIPRTLILLSGPILALAEPEGGADEQSGLIGFAGPGRRCR